MFHLFSVHGKVVEGVIPGLKEGRRRRFGFVRFMEVKDPGMMAIKLDNVFIRGIKLHVNLPRHSRVANVETKSRREVPQVEPSRKEIVQVDQPRDRTIKKVWVKKKVEVEEKRGLLTFNVGEDTIQRFRNAMVGEVLWPGKSYAIQNEFVMQGVFSITATPMGANLVLLEGAKDEEDFMGFVEEAKDWLFQWFRWIRPWKPEDVDDERVAWIRCFGIPAHAWSGDFFSKLVDQIGVYLYSDDNTERKKSMDVARVLIRTKSTEPLSQTTRVCINNVMYPIKLVEDWCGPLQWSQKVDDVDKSDDSSDSESWYKEEEWGEEEEEEGDGGEREEEGERINENFNALMQSHDSRKVVGLSIEKGIKAIDEHNSNYLNEGAILSSACEKSMTQDSNTNSGPASSWVKDTLSSNVGKAHEILLGQDVNSEGVGSEKQGVSLVSPIQISSQRPTHNNTLVLPSIQIAETPVTLRENNEALPASNSKFQRKERKYLSVAIPKKSSLWSKPQRVVHELEEVSGNSMNGASVPECDEVQNVASSSTLFSAGTVLCDDSIASSEIRICNNKFWALQSKVVARRVWESAKEMGVEGSRPDEVYIEVISEGEKRDEAARKKGKTPTGLS